MDNETNFGIKFIGEKTVSIKEGQTILSASLQAGIPHFNACHGKAQCSTCRILVAEGSENLSPVNEKEQALRQRIACSFNTRLACQTYVTGQPVSVHRVIRDQTDVFVYVSKADDERHELGEEKELALFFLDIRDFTPFIEANLPFDVMHVMRRLFRLFKKVIEDNDGKIIETAGDEIYAVFGLKATRQQGANAAVAAGLSILKELEIFNSNYLKPYFNVSFDVGIGIHTGNVMVGNVGLGITNNMSVMGLPVNIASRLQSATKQLNNSFIVSDDVFKLLPEPVEAAAKKIKLKGVKKELLVYLLGKNYSDRSSDNGDFY